MAHAYDNRLIRNDDEDESEAKDAEKHPDYVGKALFDSRTKYDSGSHQRYESVHTKDMTEGRTKNMTETQTYSGKENGIYVRQHVKEKTRMRELVRQSMFMEK